MPEQLGLQAITLLLEVRPAQNRLTKGAVHRNAMRFRLGEKDSREENILHEELVDGALQDRSCRQHGGYGGGQ